MGTKADAGNVTVIPTGAAPTPLPLRATPAAACVHELRPGSLHARGLELLAVSEHGRDTADVCLLLGQDKRDALARAPGAAGPADAVDVALAVRRRVVVD